MSDRLPDRIRELGRAVTKSGTGRVSLDELCMTCGGITGSDVFLFSADGTVPDCRYRYEVSASEIKKQDDAVAAFAGAADSLLKITETRENLRGEELIQLFGKEYGPADCFHLVVPVTSAENRVATLVSVHRAGGPYTDEDIAVTEFCAAVAGLEISGRVGKEDNENYSAENAVNQALDTLSFSEYDATVKIFNELNGDEGILVVKSVADSFNITRSVIVSALKKLECAGLIETRSLGTKGTHVRIKSAYLKDQIYSSEIRDGFPV